MADDKGDADKAAKETAEKLSALEKENADLKTKYADYEKQKLKENESLGDKAKAARDRDLENAHLESALKFNLTSSDFLKNNEALLPKEVTDIFKAAETEKYDSAVQKASAIKSDVIQEFFKLQANVDLLTPSHKLALEQYLKLTKNGKEEKAEYVYENIFEPALNMLRSVKKAEQLNKSEKNQSDGEKAYADRMMKMSRKHYLGEKENA